MPIREYLEEFFAPEMALQVKILASVVILIVLSLSRYIAHQVINRQSVDVRQRHHRRKWANYLAALIGVLILGRLWLENLVAMSTFLGLLTAGLAIALQGPLSNLAGWLYVLSRSPFEVGDRVEIGDTAGDVIDISLFQFTLLEIGNWVHADQSTGRVVHVPHRKLFDLPLANYTKGFDYIWNEIEVPVTFESNWQLAKGILMDIATRDAANLSTNAEETIRQAAHRFAIVYHKLTPIVYLRVVEHGVMLTIRYLCAPRRRRTTEQEIWEDILLEFAKHPDIQFAYPTQRFYQAHAEHPQPNTPPPLSPDILE